LEEGKHTGEGRRSSGEDLQRMAGEKLKERRTKKGGKERRKGQYLY